MLSFRGGSAVAVWPDSPESRDDVDTTLLFFEDESLSHGCPADYDTLDAPRRWLRTQLDIDNHEKSIDDVLDEDSDEDSKAVLAPQAIDEDDLLVVGVRV